MKYKILTFILLVFTFSSLSQEELDAIFDDPKKTFSLNVGTSVTSLIGGRLNVNGDVKLLHEKIIIEGGVGVIPFRYALSLLGVGVYVRTQGVGFMSTLNVAYKVASFSDERYNLYVGLTTTQNRYKLSNDPLGFDLLTSLYPPKTQIKSTFLGASFRASYLITKNLSIIFGTNLGLEIVKKKFDSSNDWLKTDEPKFSLGLWPRFSIRYCIF